MNEKFPEYKGLDLSEVNKEILKTWEENKTFEMSLKTREGHPSFVFYEGPPSANGMPGIHHVMARTIKDVICRYKTLQGFLVERKAGWDTHGLPVELGVEKKLGITKEAIGKTISVVMNSGSVFSSSAKASSISAWLTRTSVSSVTSASTVTVSCR